MISSFDSTGEKIFRIANTLFLLIITALFLIPFLITLAGSFISENEYLSRSGLILVPNNPDSSAYSMLLMKGSAVFTAFRITIFRTFIGGFLQIMVTAALAYGLSKRNLMGRKFLITGLVICLVFPVQIIPQYLVVKNFGLVDSLWSLVFPWLINTQYVFIMMAFFQQIPESLEEAAIIDGCSHLTIFIRIILPLSLASIATIGLFYAVWQWNSWYDAAMFINDSAKYPVQNLLRTILVSSTMDSVLTENNTNPPPSESIKGAIIVITSLPILCIYPFVQKYFVKGFMVGSVKG
ncbi:MULTISPECIES: carbohydrate ABC transporter permease [unclassified Oceanispirochaeta]|uniref:carbohydrate ABC transporter permease n=1 Tax=unclassified Oceanispirochaeta TaxID=2635722 RepID=UPI000E096975|nr:MULTISPECIES: carbohydrate ABC transporter permease [unclassified Oceanispirochaeta]MBF9017627.1 carbohydrate ABC transporter permease [Oceanispirochaeta sp. M2]NPD74199.1 carbohydrate ABC transporter permease [Oceanispirochaeta sp. M1]RDG30011.1 carbohydrate ABC transporter permease [Oceanispirochaeta sp. M1]